MSEHFDAIIIGGGTAGCVAAARLSEDPDRKVLLVERGADPQPIPDMVADPTQALRLRTESPYIDRYPTERNFDKSTFDSLAGRILGGGSAVNMMSIVRPIRADFDAWVAAGNPEWSWEKVLPVFKRMEADQDFPDGPLHGRDGPLYVKRGRSFDDRLAGIEKAFVEGALSLGLPKCPDQNVPNPLGIAPTLFNIKNGRRQSAADAYLGPARSRPNLSIVAEALVTSLQVEGNRVEAVHYEKDGQAQSVLADLIIVSAGVYHSPQILMLSGIGPPAELERHGIHAVHAMNGVGENFQDHAVVFMDFEGGKKHQEERLISGFILYVKSDPNRTHLDSHVMVRPPTVVQDSRPIYRISAHLLEQRTRGRVFLKSADPREPPGIDPQMLEDPEDVSAMVSVMQFVEGLAQTKPMKEYFGPLLRPDPGGNWAEYARSSYDSFRHGVGTCRMGPASDDKAVVDERLRVHGMANLFVADTSIMPTVPHAHTNLAAMMIGERVADFIKEDT